MFQSRWWPWHLLCAVVIAALVFLGYWQMQVAFNPGEWHGEELSVRNFVYALQWWVFAAFGIWFWYRYMRDQRESEIGVAAEDSAIARAREAGISGLAGPTDGAIGSNSLRAGEGSSDGAESDEPISLDAPAAERRKQIFGLDPALDEGVDDVGKSDSQNDEDDDKGSVSGS